MGNKFNAKRTWSALCEREFSSMAEARRAEELRLLEMALMIQNLEYQVKFILCLHPKITITIDFRYTENGTVIHEDVKGVMTRDSRTKLAWLEEKHGVSVKITR